MVPSQLVTCRRHDVASEPSSRRAGRIAFATLYVGGGLLAGAPVVHAQASTRGLSITAAVDSVSVGRLKVFARITPGPSSQQQFTLAVWVVNPTADTTIFSYGCHSAQLDFVPETTTGGARPVSWTPNLLIDPVTGARTECPSSAYARFIPPRDTVRPSELGGASPINDRRLAPLVAGRYRVVLRLHVGVGIAPPMWNDAKPFRIALGTAFRGE